MVKPCVNYLKICTKYTIFMHIKKKKEIRGDPHSQEGIKTEFKLQNVLRYLKCTFKKALSLTRVVLKKIDIAYI